MGYQHLCVCVCSFLGPVSSSARQHQGFDRLQGFEAFGFSAVSILLYMDSPKSSSFVSSSGGFQGHLRAPVALTF